MVLYTSKCCVFLYYGAVKFHRQKFIYGLNLLLACNHNIRTQHRGHVYAYKAERTWKLYEIFRDFLPTAKKLLP